SPPTLVKCADTLRLSFPVAIETSPHRVMAWDQAALSARSGDANKLLRSLAGELRALQTSMCFVKLGQALRDGTKLAALRLPPNKPRPSKPQQRAERAN